MPTYMASKPASINGLGPGLGSCVRHLLFSTTSVQAFFLWRSESSGGHIKAHERITEKNFPHPSLLGFPGAISSIILVIEVLCSRAEFFDTLTYFDDRTWNIADCRHCSCRSKLPGEILSPPESGLPWLYHFCIP